MKRKIIGLIAASFCISSCVYNDIPDIPEIPVVVDCEKVDLSIEVTDTVNASVCGAFDGSLSVQASGGERPYLFSIDDQPEQTDSVFSGLTSGFYSIRVSDKNQCSHRLDSVLITVDQFDVSFLITSDSACLSGNGSMQITVLEANGPYQFKLDQQGFTSSNLFEDLEQGDHVLVIQDNDGCNVQMMVDVPRGFTGVSWANDILPVFTTYCAVSGCHNGVSRPNDWRVYSQTKLYAATIRKKTQDRSMPFDGTLSQDQIDMIACWVDDGALQN